MASDVTHSATLRGEFAQGVADDTDGGSGAGRIQVCTSGDAVLATFTCAATAWSRTGAVLTLQSTPLETTATGTGTAAYAKVISSDTTDKIIQGTVGTSEADFIIDNTSITSGQTVRITSCTYTATE